MANAIKVSIAIMLVITFDFCRLYGQQNPIKDISIASPTAASLGKYGDIPVSYHTGIPQISIPLYTIQDGPLKLPVSMSYHASGLKVMELASWVGAGWSLSAGGMITRSVSSAPDDRGFGSVSNVSNGHFSNYGYNNYYWVNYSGNGCPPATADNKLIDGSPIVNGTADYEPDIFTFNFLGYSGKFYFRDDRMPTLVPEQDIRIQPITQTSADNIYGFILTTPDGTKYYFGKNQLSDGNIDAYEVTSPYASSTGITNGTCISSWFLNRIVSADGKFSVKLIYVSDQYSYYTISMFPLPGTEPSTTKEYKLIKNNLDGVRLSQIITSAGTMSFIAGSARLDLSGYNTSTIEETTNSNGKTLGSIEINNNQGFCKAFLFQYDYFIDNTTSLPGGISAEISSATIDKKRLRLKQIQERSCDSTIVIPAYKFSYSTPSGDPDFAPRGLNFAQDHWGFYNGKTSNDKLIPTYTVDNFNVYPGADRESSWPEMSYGTLKRIQYPTGGTTDFEFEPNDIWSDFPYYEEVSRLSSAIGPGVGQSGNQTLQLNCSGNIYKIILDFHWTNPSTTGTASIASINVSRTSPHAEQTIQPSSGNQNFYFNMSNMTGVDYATVTFYEEIPHTYQGNKTVGGLRIKTITNSDSVTSVLNKTHYSYLVNGESSGILYGRPTYVEFIRNDIYEMVGTPTALPLSTYGCYFPDGYAGDHLKSPSPLRPLSNTQGNHIGYNEVKVSKTGNGFSIFRYYGSDVWDIDQRDVAIRNVSSTCSQAIPNFPHAPLPTEYKRGELKYEGHYNESGQLLKESTYYPVYTESPVKTPGVVYWVNSSTGNGKTRYELSTAKKTRVTVVSRDYSSPGHALTTIDSSFYESPNHSMLTRSVTTNSKGEILETKYKYASDYRVASFDTLSDCYAQYSSAATTALNTLNYQLATCSSSGSCNCKYTAFNQYERDISLARIAYVNCRRTKFMDSINTYKTNHDYAKANADSELKPLLQLQDDFENPVIESSTWKRSLLASASFSKYDYNPDSNVYVNKTKLINLAALSPTFSQSTTTSNSVTKDSRYKDETSYSFETGNLSQYVPYNGVGNSYLWDYVNQNPIAKIINAGSEKFAYTSFEADGKGNWTFSGTPVTDYTCPTGKKVYVLNGSNNVTRSSLNSTTTYIVTYWAKSSSPLSIAGTISGYPISGRTIDGWRLFEHRVNGQSTVTITGTVSIDELRLYPSTAQMNTYTYTPLLGLIAQCDANNRVSYYEYDKLGRLTIIKDQDKRILKKICYNYSGQTENCSSGYYVNVLKNGNYYKNDCGSGYSGTSVTYNVNPGSYSSPVSQAYVDSLAQADVYANGQAYANANGSCNCDTNTCTGPSQKCIYNVCYTGELKCVSSVYNSKTNLWTCTYRYVFSIDCSSNFSHTTQSASSCAVDPPCH